MEDIGFRVNELTAAGHLVSAPRLVNSQDQGVRAHFDVNVTQPGYGAMRLPVWAEAHVASQAARLDRKQLILVEGAVESRKTGGRRRMVLCPRRLASLDVQGGGWVHWQVAGPVGGYPELNYDNSGNAYTYVVVAVSAPRFGQTEWARVLVRGDEAERCSGVVLAGMTVWCQGRPRIQRSGAHAGEWVLDPDGLVQLVGPRAHDGVAL